LSGERLYDLYSSYYGSTTYADDWVSAAINGSGVFEGKPDIVREEAALKGVAYGNVWMYVLHELEVAIKDITERDDAESAVKHASDCAIPSSRVCVRGAHRVRLLFRSGTRGGLSTPARSRTRTARAAGSFSTRSPTSAASTLPPARTAPRARRSPTCTRWRLSRSARAAPRARTRAA